jgi:LPS-assembly lipoprotein
LLSKKFISITFCLVVSSCGFQPLYSSLGSENIIANFSEIRIVPTKDRIGQILSNQLKHLLNPLYGTAKSKYYLVTTLTISAQSLAVKKTAFATRSKLEVVSNYQLFNSLNHKLISTGYNTVIASYNIYSSHYATLSAEKDAKTRAVKSLAQDIRIQLGAFFKAQNQLSIVQ